MNFSTFYRLDKTKFSGIFVLFFSMTQIQSAQTASQVSYDVSLDVRKPVFGVSDQVRHKPGCTATEDG